MNPFAALALSGTRRAIDGVDDAMVALLAGRHALVGAAMRLKRGAGIPPRDAYREWRVQQRAQRLAARLGIPAEAAAGLMALLIAEAHRQQALPSRLLPAPATDTDMPFPTDETPAAYRHLLRMIPPPRHWKRLLALLPQSAQAAMVETLLSRTLSASLETRMLEPIQGRRLGIEVSDLGLYWVLELREGRLRTSAGIAEATVCGSATDLLLLASRLEDADTLFFQRRLMLTGDTELGLTVRNLLDRMPWETVPLGLRIALHRGGRLARAARASYHGNA